MAVREERNLERFVFNSTPPGQNGHYFADDIFRFISGNEKFCDLIKISLGGVALRWISRDALQQLTKFEQKSPFTLSFHGASAILCG